MPSPETPTMQEPAISARPDPRPARVARPLSSRGRAVGWIGGGLALALAALPLAAAADTPAPARQQALVRMVRQDCGSCHGMRLTGGLGPALTREAMADRPLDAMVATIVHGRPGTPMPGWRAMLSEAEARWIAEQLAAGFPEESRTEPRKAAP